MCDGYHAYFYTIHSILYTSNKVVHPADIAALGTVYLTDYGMTDHHIVNNR